MDKIAELSVADLKKLYNLLEINGHSKEWFIEQLKKWFDNAEEPVAPVAEVPVAVANPQERGRTARTSNANLSAKERKSIANKKAYLKRIGRS